MRRVQGVSRALGFLHLSRCPQCAARVASRRVRREGAAPKPERSLESNHQGCWAESAHCWTRDAKDGSKLEFSLSRDPGFISPC